MVKHGEYNNEQSQSNESRKIMKSKELAKKLLEHPDFEVKFHDFHQEFPGGPVVCDSWENVEITDIGYSDKVIILTGEIE